MKGWNNLCRLSFSKLDIKIVRTYKIIYTLKFGLTSLSLSPNLQVHAVLILWRHDMNSMPTRVTTRVRMMLGHIDDEEHIGEDDYDERCCKAYWFKVFSIQIYLRIFCLKTPPWVLHLCILGKFPFVSQGQSHLDWNCPWIQPQVNIILFCKPYIQNPTI